MREHERDFRFFWGGQSSRGAFKQRCGQEANDDLDAAVKTVRDMVSSLRLDVDARRRKAGCQGGAWALWGGQLKMWFACLCYLRSELCMWLLHNIMIMTYYVCFFPYSLRMILQDSRFGFERYSLQGPENSKPRILASCQVDEILATVRHDITAVETNLEETWWGCSTMISISTNICLVGFWCWCEEFVGWCFWIW